MGCLRLNYAWSLMVFSYYRWRIASGTFGFVELSIQHADFKGFFEGTRKGNSHPIPEKQHVLTYTPTGVAPHMLQAPEKHNLCIVSADYRLAPQTRMPGILEDCLDAIDFIHNASFAEQTGHRADPSKLVVSGSSAGGWLSLLAGAGIGFKACGLPAPRPVQGIVAIYPITDLLDPFWKTKQRPVSYMDRVIDSAEVESFVDPTSPKTSSAAVDGKRSIFYHYMVQESVFEFSSPNIPYVTHLGLPEPFYPLFC